MSLALAMLALLAGTETVSVRDLVEAPRLSGLRVSPDAHLVAFRTSSASVAGNDFRLQWWVVPADGSAPARPIGSAGGALFLSGGPVEEQTPIWSPQSDAIYYRALIDGEIQIWRAPIDGSGPIRVTHEDGNVTRLALAQDGMRIDYQVGPARSDILVAEQRDADQGTLVDAHSDLAQPLLRASWIDGRLATQRIAGPWFGRGGILWQRPPRLRSIGFSGSRDADPRDEAAATPADAAPPILLLGDIGRPRHLRVTDEDGAGHECTQRSCVAEAIVSGAPLGKTQVLVTSEDGHFNQTLSIWTPASGVVRTLRKDHGLLSGSDDERIPCATGGPVIVCVAQAADAPPQLVRISSEDGARSLLYDPNAELRRRSPIEVRALDWDWAPGQAMTGELIVPPTPRPGQGYPLVINYYLCPGYLRGGIGDALPMQPLARSGVAILCVNHVLGPKPWISSDNYDIAEKGLRRIIARLTAEGLIDPKRIGMAGLSFGSEVTMRMVRDTSLLAAAAIASTQLGPTYYWLSAMPGSDFPQMLEHAWQVGSPDKDPRRWKQISSALNVADIRTPILMQMPENEARNSIDLYSRLAATRTPVELHAFAHEAHILEEPRHQAFSYERNLDWFRFWLQDWADPATEKAGQYARWRALASRWRGQDGASPELGVGQP